ncbi:MAG: hypothetical protein GY704_16605 [Phycisphaeraceae bacterium]|nr:hypothetical protein [Phycisphaeraceae bacterium]
MSVEPVDFGWSDRRRRNAVPRAPQPRFVDIPSDIRGSGTNPGPDSKFDGHRENRVLDLRPGDLEVSDSIEK